MSNPAPHREPIASLGTGGDRFETEQILEELRVGTDYLDVSIGFLTRIDEDTQRIVCSTGDHPLLQPGRQCPLDSAYCQHTIETESALSVQSADAADSIPPAAVETFELETYTGAKITVNGDLFGTVCFADRDARPDPFTETEELYVELLAERIGNTLGRQSYERELSRQNERLKAEKRRFEGIARASTDIIFRIDDATTFTYVSPAMDRLLGYDHEALVGESFLDVVSPSSVETALDLYERARCGEPIDGAELRLEPADGGGRVFEVNARPLGEAGDGGAGVQGTARDITDRKDRQRELEIKNRAMDEAELGIVITDLTRAGNPITYVNEEFCDLTGYDHETVIGRNCRFLQGEATDPETVARFRQAVEAEEPVSVDVVNYRPSGYAFWNEVSITPVENESGEVDKYVGFQRDVTERKRRQQLLSVMNRVLRHNLRNEMGIILGATAETWADGAEDRRAMVRAAAEALRSLAEQAREIYRYAGAERKPERIDPGSLVADLSEEFAGDHPDATVVQTVETDRDIAAGAELRRAVAELMENAVTHDPAPGTTVEVAARDDGDEIVLTVVDDGPGINETERAVVQNGRESPLEHSGGLGLWFVNWVVTRYGGSFQLSTRTDSGESGTVATIRLPAVGPEQDVASASRRPTLLAE